MDDEIGLEEGSGIRADLCIICQCGGDLSSCSTGLQKLIDYSIAIGNNTLTTFCTAKLEDNASVNIHRKCQRVVGNTLLTIKRKAMRTTDSSDAKTRKITRAYKDVFDWMKQCMYCGKYCNDQLDKNVSQVMTMEYKDRVLSVCAERNDALSEEVRCRVINCIDLVQAEAKVSSGSKTIIDGGALLHRLKWIPGQTFQELFQHYASYLKTKYGQCHVAFDGYESGPSTKDHEHLRRSAKIAPNITISSNAIVQVTQEAFFRNESNKCKFINELAKELREHQIVVQQSDGDADVLIAEMALRLAKEGESVVVVADDTDVFCILLHHWNSTMGDIFFRSERKGRQRNQREDQVWNMRDVSIANQSIKEHVLFIHAWGGCDTTSATYMQTSVTTVSLFKMSYHVVFDVLKVCYRDWVLLHHL